MSRKEELLGFFTKLSDAFWEARSSDGLIICPKHGLDHTGKTSTAIELDLFLYERTGEERYLKRARAQAEFVAGRFESEVSSGKTSWHLAPGSDRGNMSNNTIDSGTGADMLESLLRRDARLPAAARTKYEVILKNVTGTRLVRDALEKALANQRLWAGTGLAAAAAYFDNGEWKNAALKSVRKVLAEIRPDGFFSYSSEPGDPRYFLPAGAAGVTPYYHSRHTAFALYMLERIGAGTVTLQEPLTRSLEALCAIVMPNGAKPMALECKRWYWHSSTEAGSHSFDIYALLKGFKLTGNEHYAATAQTLLKDLFMLQNNKGFLDPARSSDSSFLCEFFPSADAIWLTRVFDELVETEHLKFEKKGVRKFLATSLIRIDAEAATLLIRNTAEPCSLSFGAGVAGGLPAASSQTIFRHQWAWSGGTESNWIFFPLRFPLLPFVKSLYRTNKRELRDQVYYMQVEAKAKRWRPMRHIFLSHFLLAPLHAFIKPFSLQWGQAKELAAEPGRYKLESGPRNREQTLACKAKVERLYDYSNTLAIADVVESHEPLLFAALVVPKNARLTGSPALRLGRYAIFLLPGKRTVRTKLSF